MRASRRDDGEQGAARNEPRAVDMGEFDMAYMFFTIPLAQPDKGMEQLNQFLASHQVAQLVGRNEQLVPVLEFRSLAPNGNTVVSRSLWRITLARRASFEVALFSRGAATGCSPGREPRVL